MLSLIHFITKEKNIYQIAKKVLKTKKYNLRQAKTTGLSVVVRYSLHLQTVWTSAAAGQTDRQCYEISGCLEMK